MLIIYNVIISYMATDIHRWKIFLQNLSSQCSGFVLISMKPLNLSLKEDIIDQITATHIRKWDDYYLLYYIECLTTLYSNPFIFWSISQCMKFHVTWKDLFTTKLCVALCEKKKTYKKRGEVIYVRNVYKIIKKLHCKMLPQG
jgi:hypothetical protein